MGRSTGHSCGTSVKPDFSNQFTNTLNLLCQVTQDFIVTGSGATFNKQYSG